MPRRYSLLVLAAVFVFAGCAMPPSASAPAATASATIVQSGRTPTSSLPTPAAVQAVDALGRVVRLATPPKRIVIAGKASLLLADAVYAFPDARQRVVALTKGKQSFGFLALLDPQVRQKAVLARNVGPEQIAAFHPDVVILKTFVYPKLGKALEAVGIPVFAMRLEAPEEYPKELRALGVLLGNEKRGEELAAFYEQKLQMLESSLAGVEHKPRVLVMRSTPRGGRVAYAVPPRGWMQTRMTVLAGGVPVWLDVQGNGWTPVTLEQIAAWDPDVIFVISYQTSPAKMAAEFSALPLAAELKAVRQHRVFPIPKDFIPWDQPDTRWVLGAQWMAKQTHPETFARLDMRKAVAEFYQQVYHLDANGLKAIWAELGW